MHNLAKKYCPMIAALELKSIKNLKFYFNFVPVDEQLYLW